MRDHLAEAHTDFIAQGHADQFDDWLRREVPGVIDGEPSPLGELLKGAIGQYPKTFHDLYSALGCLEREFSGDDQ